MKLPTLILLLALCATATAKPTPRPKPRPVAPSAEAVRAQAIVEAQRLLAGIVTTAQAQQAELVATKAALLESSVAEAKLATWAETESRRADAEKVRADKETKARVAAEKAYHRIKWPLCIAGAALAVFVCLQFGLARLGPAGYWVMSGAAVAVFGALAVWL